MQSSLFDEYERRQSESVRLNWILRSEPVAVAPAEYLHSGELITVHPSHETQNSAFYVLTTKYLIESSDAGFKSPVNALSTLRLRHPRVKKVAKPELGLYC